MANGRLYLVCSHCGDRTLLMKGWVHRVESYKSDVTDVFVENHLLWCYDLPGNFAPNENGELFSLEGE